MQDRPSPTCYSSFLHFVSFWQADPLRWGQVNCWVAAGVVFASLLPSRKTRIHWVSPRTKFWGLFHIGHHFTCTALMTHLIFSSSRLCIVISLFQVRKLHLRKDKTSFLGAQLVNGTAKFQTHGHLCFWSLCCGRGANLTLMIFSKYVCPYLFRRSRALRFTVFVFSTFPLKHEDSTSTPSLEVHVRTRHQPRERRLVGCLEIRQTSVKDGKTKTMEMKKINNPKTKQSQRTER